MSAVAPWQDLLQQPQAGNHIVQLYQNDGFLAESVCHFISAGIKQGDAVIIIATAAHRAMFTDQLALEDASLQEAVQRGQVKFFDAETMLSAFMTAGVPQWSVFAEVIGQVMREAQAEYGTVRAYGEMVDVLWQKGERDAAIRLEEFWNELAKQCSFSLLCAYFLDNLSPGAYEDGLECICHQHSHMIPAQNYDLLETVVHEAGHDVLGESLANMLCLMAAQDKPATDMPGAQASLLYLSKNMPFVASKVLSQAKARYAAEEPHP